MQNLTDAPAEHESEELKLCVRVFCVAVECYIMTASFVLSCVDVIHQSSEPKLPPDHHRKHYTLKISLLEYQMSIIEKYEKDLRSYICFEGNYIFKAKKEDRNVYLL